MGMAKMGGWVKILLDIDQVFREEEMAALVSVVITGYDLHNSYRTGLRGCRCGRQNRRGISMPWAQRAESRARWMTPYVNDLTTVIKYSGQMGDIAKATDEQSSGHRPDQPGRAGDESGHPGKRRQRRRRSPRPCRCLRPLKAGTTVTIRDFPCAPGKDDPTGRKPTKAVQKQARPEQAIPLAEGGFKDF